jgi:putative PIN family toxin of toxin-antitoxin system
LSGKSIKAFLDANIILSGLLFQGNEATLLELGRARAIILATNQYVIEEVTAVLKRKEFRITTKETDELLRYLNTCLTAEKNPPENSIINNIDLLYDRKDIPVALGAAYSKADYLVTGDKELLEKISNSITTRRLLDKILPGTR